VWRTRTNKVKLVRKFSGSSPAESVGVASLFWARILTRRCGGGVPYFARLLLATTLASNQTVIGSDRWFIFSSVDPLLVLIYDTHRASRETVVPFVFKRIKWAGEADSYAVTSSSLILLTRFIVTCMRGCLYWVSWASVLNLIRTAYRVSTVERHDFGDVLQIDRFFRC
jgi:hypothetical protein